MTRQAMIHSLNDTREVEVIQYKDSNHVITQYEGHNYTAIDNPFTGLLYVDDLYGKVSLEFRF